jgi:hypothetical protein
MSGAAEELALLAAASSEMRTSSAGELYLSAARSSGALTGRRRNY